MTEQQLIELINELVKQPQESEWVEFKLNFHSPEEIGEQISSLANGASIRNQDFGYLVFGVEDQTHIIKGTSFKAKSQRKGGEDLEHWLTSRLNPKIDFTVCEFEYDAHRHISLYVIPAAKSQPVEFLHQAYIRIGSITKKLNEYPEKQAKIWKKNVTPFEKEIAMDNLSVADIIHYLSTETYFDLMMIPYPSSQQSVIDKFMEEGLVIKNAGYSQLPANEEIGKALRKESRMYPEVAIRELVANALVHQDLTEKGFPMIEIFSDRIEISNPGTPLVTPERFIDSYVSRNDKLADIMRRMGFCEEKGSGMDKVIFNIELYQLPPLNVVVAESRTRVTMYSYKTLLDLEKKEKVRACYKHACLKYVSNEKMTNQSLRDRFKIADQNSASASRIIADALKEGVIKKEDPESTSRKFPSYLPIWA